jgi:hypothetical protein
MPGITLDIAQAHLDTWLAAETKVAAGQVVVHKGSQLTRADLGQIRLQIDYWAKYVERLSRNASGLCVQRLVLHD